MVASPKFALLKSSFYVLMILMTTYNRISFSRIPVSRANGGDRSLPGDGSKANCVRRALRWARISQVCVVLVLCRNNLNSLKPVPECLSALCLQTTRMLRKVHQSIGGRISPPRWHLQNGENQRKNGGCGLQIKVSARIKVFRKLNK